MPREVDRDTRLIIVISILVVQVVLIGSMLVYFRKKENDTLNTLFQLQERIGQIELKVQHGLNTLYTQGLPPSKGQ